MRAGLSSSSHKERIVVYVELFFAIGFMAMAGFVMAFVIFIGYEIYQAIREWLFG